MLNCQISTTAWRTVKKILKEKLDIVGLTFERLHKKPRHDRNHAVFLSCVIDNGAAIPRPRPAFSRRVTDSGSAPAHPRASGRLQPSTLRISSSDRKLSSVRLRMLWQSFLRNCQSYIICLFKFDSHGYRFVFRR